MILNVILYYNTRDWSWNPALDVAILVARIRTCGKRGLGAVTRQTAKYPRQAVVALLWVLWGRKTKQIRLTRYGPWLWLCCCPLLRTVRSLWRVVQDATAARRKSIQILIGE